MKRSAYHDRDYAFGQEMLTLRTAIGLTQTGLADYLGVSRRSVGDWEAGSSYPKVKHLKQFIALAVQHRAFAAGREADEIRALWQAARQKVLLDEQWLVALLAPPAGEETTGVAPPAVGRRVDWDDALSTPTFYGREWELSLLKGWVVEEHCRVVSVLGMGGIGKSALAVSLMHRLAEQFEVVIWRSLRDIPTCEVPLDNLLEVAAPQALAEPSLSLERRQSVLLEFMRSTRVLLVLDNLESVLEEGEGMGHMLPGYEGFGRFLRFSAETQHQSCVLLTSREKPADLVALEGSRAPVRALRLARLDSDACEQLLAEKGVRGTVPERAHLIEAYAGNPLALKIVAQTIVDLFDGEIAPFLAQGEVIFGGVRELLKQQFARLSTLEQCVLLWLAIMREPATLDELLSVLVTPVTRARLLEAIEALRRRSLIERGQKQGSFTLHPVVLEYATTLLITEVVEEIMEGRLARLIEHGLELAQAREYVRQNQKRLILAPILARLRGAYPQQAAVDEQLRALLAQLTSWADDAQGYGPANLVALLRLQRGNLRGLDLSRLTLRGVHLQGVAMQDAALADATIRDSIFTETFDAITAVAAGNGTYWSAASRGGEIRIWDVGGLILRRAWQAHADMVWALAFSPDGRRLASGSWDGTVKLWDITSGALLWSGRHASHVNTVAFAPDGSILASSGNDATVRLWDVRSGTQLQVLSHPVPVPVVAWSLDGRLTATGDLEGCIRLWEMQKDGTTSKSHTLIGHTDWVDGLAFAPDASTLASASWDGTVKLWEVSGGHLMHTLDGHTDRVSRVAWSLDGRTLASGSRDHTIWLWDVEQGSYRAILRGHTAGVNGIAFSPNSHSLLSGSEDGTLRVWDVTSGYCTRVMQGYASALYDLDWSPDGIQLVSGGTDYLVTVYDVTESTPPRVLRGHGGVVFGVGWSSDGERLASSEWDNAIRLWDPASGACLQVLQHPDDPGNYFYGLAWSPDGTRLASATYRRGVQAFEIDANHQRWVGRPFPIWIRPVAWSPDGTRLVGGGDDGSVYIWDAEDGALLQALAGHQNMVTSVAWNPDGTRLASGGSGVEGGELFVWDLQGGAREHRLAGHPGIVYAVAWDPHGDLLVSGSSDGRLRWWDVQSEKCVLVREAHEGTVHSLRRSPDGTKLASCGDDGAIMLWNLRSGQYLQTLRRDRPYERLNITGIRGLTEAQKITLRALGAIEGTSV